MVINGSCAEAVPSSLTSVTCHMLTSVLSVNLIILQNVIVSKM